jgi:hypothetical protein
LKFLRAISNVLRFDRTNWKVLSLCFFAAAIFWMFNALNKDYATNVRFPLQIEFDDTKYIAVEPLPPNLMLNVQGNGWEILRRRLGIKVPKISLAFERPADARKIPAATLSPMAATQIGSLHLNFIVTDTLRLKIEPKISRKLRLAAWVKNVAFRKNLGRTSRVVILPDSVELLGPKSLIESLPDSIMLNVTGSRVNTNFRENVEVVVPHNDLISRNPPVAEVMFDVGPVEEIAKQVPLRMAKVPWGVEVELDSVKCVFLVPQKDRETFMKEQLYTTVAFNYDSIRKGQTLSLLPDLKGLPAYAQVIRIDSVKIKKY